MCIYIYIYKKEQLPDTEVTENHDIIEETANDYDDETGILQQQLQLQQVRQQDAEQHSFDTEEQNLLEFNSEL